MRINKGEELTSNTSYNTMEPGIFNGLGLGLDQHSNLVTSGSVFASNRAIQKEVTDSSKFPALISNYLPINMLCQTSPFRLLAKRKQNVNKVTKQLWHGLSIKYIKRKGHTNQTESIQVIFIIKKSMKCDSTILNLSPLCRLLYPTMWGDSVKPSY